MQACAIEPTYGLYKSLAHGYKCSNINEPITLEMRWKQHHKGTLSRSKSKSYY